MDYQNITLSIPKSTLKKAKHIAVEKGISLSKFLTESMEDAVNKNGLYLEAMKRSISSFDENELGTNGNFSISKEELHE